MLSFLYRVSMSTEVDLFLEPGCRSTNSLSWSNLRIATVWGCSDGLWWSANLRIATVWGCSGGLWWSVFYCCLIVFLTRITVDCWRSELKQELKDETLLVTCSVVISWNVLSSRWTIFVWWTVGGEVPTSPLGQQDMVDQRHSLGSRAWLTNLISWAAGHGWSTSSPGQQDMVDHICWEAGHGCSKSSRGQQDMIDQHYH